MSLELPRTGTVAGLRRLMSEPDVAVRVESFISARKPAEFGTMRPGVDYWPTGGSHPNRVRFINSVTPIAYMWGQLWTYRWEDDDHEAIIATRKSEHSVLTIRIHQPEVLAANWSESLEPDRIENDDA